MALIGKTDAHMEKRNNSQDSAKTTINEKELVEEHISRIYHLHKRIGKGAYGIVYKATHKFTNKTVAIKKIFNAFINETEAKRTYREIFFLQELRSHPNIITLFSLHQSSTFKDMYLIFEYMDVDLHHYIKQGKRLEIEHIRYITYQILKGLKFIHSASVIHRDLKPANILLNSRCEAKIADFGLARCIKSKENFVERNLTEYVATRWYRAPEILLGCTKYTRAIDLWSVGCILAEMLKGEPLFPGTSSVNQLELILSAVPESALREIGDMCTGLGKKMLEWSPDERMSIKKLLPDAPIEVIDLTVKFLSFNPKKRFGVVEGLRHPFLYKHHDPLNEPVLGRPLYLDLLDSGSVLKKVTNRTSIGETKGVRHYHHELAPVIGSNTRKFNRIPFHQRLIKIPPNPLKPQYSRTFSLNNYVKQNSETRKNYPELKKHPVQWLKINSFKDKL